MWCQPSKHLFLAAVVLFVPAWVTGQDRPAAAEPQYKDQGEFSLYDSILKDTNPKTRLDKLQEWQAKYTATDFIKQRRALFLDTYVNLNQPKEAVAAAKEVLADDPKDFKSLYYTMYFTRALAGDNRRRNCWIKARRPRAHCSRTWTRLRPASRRINGKARAPQWSC
jgi:hypothetical protein